MASTSITLSQLQTVLHALRKSIEYGEGGPFVHDDGKLDGKSIRLARQADVVLTNFEQIAVFNRAYRRMKSGKRTDQWKVKLEY